MAAVVGVGIAAFSKQILGVYGEGYQSGRMTFILMIISAILYTAQVQTGFIMQSMKKMWLSALSNGVWGGVLIISYAILISLGSFGYAAAYCISYLVALFLQIAIVRWQLNSV